MQTTTPAGLTYLEERGLTPATIAEMQPMYLTPTPDEDELTRYQQYLHEKRVTGKGEFRKTVEGLIIPYLTIAARYQPFGRQRILTPAPEFVEWHAKRGESVRKFDSPSKAALKGQPGAHLYHLPHDAAKMGKSTAVFLLAEGEVKTAALSQWARTLDDGNNAHVCVGAGGVSMFLCCPEWPLPLKDRRVFLFFDSDSFDKREVMQAELRVFLACLMLGARAVFSCAWHPDQGKGIDDHLAFVAGRDCDPAEALRTLMQQAVSPLRKYARPPFAHLAAYPLDHLCDEVVKQPLKPFILSMLAHELAQSYHDRGLTVKDVRRELDAARRRKRERDKADQPVTVLQEEFEISYTPRIPDPFDLSNGQLCFQDVPVCSKFVISKYVYTESQHTPDIYQLAFRDKSLLLPSTMQSQFKEIAKIFNQNREVLFDGSAKAVQRYISQFYHENRAAIPTVPLFENTGWHRDGFFQLPDITIGEHDAVYPEDLTKIFKPRGERAEQYALVEEILTRHHAGLFTVIGLAAPCVSLLSLPLFSVVVYGKQGAGKSKGAEVAVSQFGDPDQLRFSMDSTKVGREITFSLYKDLPILLDEFNTAGADGKKVAQQVIDSIYGFSQGRGRARGNTHIKHQQIAEYSGLLFMTSESSLESIFHNVQSMRVGGAYRRTLEIPVIDKTDLWNLNPETDATHTQLLSRIHHSIRKHYGWVGLDWLLHLADPEVRDRLAFEYDTALHLLIEDGYGNLEGTEKLIALLFAVMKELEFFLQLDALAILTNLTPFVKAILKRQQRQIDEQITDETEKFKDRIQHFLATHLTCFEGLCPERAVMAQVFGKVWYTDTQTHIKLFAGTFRDFCCEYGFERDILLPELEKRGIIKKQSGDRYYGPDSVANTKGKTYYFVIESHDTGVINDLSNTTQHADAGTQSPDRGAAAAGAAEHSARRQHSKPHAAAKGSKPKGRGKTARA